MFFVVNKEKIVSYLISVGTVAILLVVSVAMQSSINKNVIQTSGNTVETPIFNINNEEKNVSITINCVQNMDNIDNIVDTLSKMHVKATFFVTGDIVDKYPKEVKKIVDNGNEIGNLSNKYTSLKNLSKDEIEKQIQECNDKIEKLTSVKPKLFRIPYGEYNNTILDIAKKMNMNVIAWDVDSLDYNELSDDEVCERISDNIKSGSIILMHNEYIKSSLETVIHNIQELGYNIETLSEILQI